MVLESVSHHFNRDVDIGHLFVKGHVRVAAFLAGDGIRHKMAVENVEIAQHLEGFKEYLLTPLPASGVGNDAGEILRLDQALMRLEEPLGEGLDIEPVRPLPLFLAQAMIQVVTVNVSDDSFHLRTLSNKRRPALSGGRRPGDAISRGVCTYYTTG